MAAVGLWLVFSPVPHGYQHKEKSVRVKVEQQQAAVGDEKIEEPQPEVQPVPPAASPEEPAPATQNPPRIAVVIDDLGLDMRDTQRAIRLPPYVTLAFLPYASRLKEQAREARAGGHELLLHLPMEPIGHADPGPGALLVGLPPEELQRRLETALASFTGFDGVNNHMGSKFTRDVEGMTRVIAELQQRELFFLDSKTSPASVGEEIAREYGLPALGRDVFLDDTISPGAIHAQIQEAERVARRKGHAVVIGHPHRETLAALEAWLPEAQKRGLRFVPVRDLIRP